MNFIFINSIVYYFIISILWCTPQTNHNYVHTHTIFGETNKQTLKEEFIGPIPDPLLNWITELSNVSANQRWILLRNLKAASVYQFRVSAVNSVGEGPPSEPSNVIRLPQEGK